ncbi:hypothetical protein T03_16909 [Trichinella britovi]|uniref:Uncharacterized protein n=1 Tax=Trichinella britovi TaxID=45882 RepID=A0A0V1C331_TRIBR|nr:hypothetical protein T03_16909 [Trichinella britovi]
MEQRKCENADDTKQNKRRQVISLLEVIYVFALILMLFDIRHPYMPECGAKKCLRDLYFVKVGQ